MHFHFRFLGILFTFGKKSDDPRRFEIDKHKRFHDRKPWVWVRKLSLQSMVERCYIRLFTLNNMHEPYKPIKFHPNKIYSENPKLNSNTHTLHVISLSRKRSQRSCIFDWKQANVTRWTHGWWKRESMRITRGLPTMKRFACTDHRFRHWSKE